MQSKEKIIELLDVRDFEALADIAKTGMNIFRVLISSTYDRGDIRCWKAIEAVGRIAGGFVQHNKSAAVRTLIGRLLWTIREESGGIGWSAPDLLGEIVRNSPDEFCDVAPVISSFHDEEMLRAGVLRALIRIAEVRPELVCAPAFVLTGRYLADEDPQNRAYSARLAGVMGFKEFLSQVETLQKDAHAVTIYKEGVFSETSVGEIASGSAIILRGEKP